MENDNTIPLGEKTIDNPRINDNEYCSPYRVINTIWYSKDKSIWNQGILEYYHMIENIEIERYIEDISSKSSIVKNMNKDELFDFLINKYFVWKYSACNRYTTCSNWLKNEDKRENFRDDLKKIINRIFKKVEMNSQNYKDILSEAKEIPGIGTSGASGLLSVLFPDKYATVDQFVVKSLICIEQPDFEYSDIEKMSQKSNDLTIADAEKLQTIMQNKAGEVGITPRQIDMVLWAVRDKSSLVYQDKQNVKWKWIIDL